MILRGQLLQKPVVQRGVDPENMHTQACAPGQASQDSALIANFPVGDEQQAACASIRVLADLPQHMLQGGEEFGAASRAKRLEVLYRGISQNLRDGQRLFGKVPELTLEEGRPHPVFLAQSFQKLLESQDRFPPFEALHAPGAIDQEIDVLSVGVGHLYFRRSAQTKEGIRLSPVACDPSRRLDHLRLRLGPPQHKIAVRRRPLVGQRHLE